MIRNAFTFLLFFFVLNPALSQDNRQADSLRMVLDKTDDTKAKSSLMKAIADAYSIESKKGIAWYNKHIAFAVRHNFDASSSINALGIYYLNRQEYNTALTYFLRQVKEAEKYGNTKQIGNAYANISIIFQEQRNFKRSLYYDAKALAISKSLHDSTGIADAYMASGITYSEMGDDEKALGFLKKALPFYLKKNDPGKIAYAYFNIGFATQEPVERIYYLEKAKTFFDVYDPAFPLAVSNLSNMAETYLLLSQNAALSAKINSTPPALLAKAESLVNASIAYSLKDNARYNLMFSYEVLAKIKEAQHKPAEALDYTRRQYALKDSLFSQEQKNDIATTESAAEIALRDKQLQLNKTLLKTRERQFWMLFGGILLFTGLMVLLFLQNAARKAQNKKLEKLNHELDIANKTKAQLFGIINHDLRGPVATLINFLNLQRNNMLDDSKKAALETKTITSANGLLQSMEDLLLWSKGQMEYFSPDIQQVTAKSLFEDIKGLYTHEPIHFSDADNVVFTSDENYLKTIMRNLTGNALKAAATATNAQIEWNAFESNGNKCLSITDNGTGAAAETFSALQGSTAGIGIKNGLGLHLVRDLATAIHCGIEVQTGANGTTITLTVTSAQ
jgi:signal transduction histidine kinase